MTLSRLHINGRRFVDESGAHVTLRGVNLGGDSKVPYPFGGTHQHSDFTDHREVSFVGRPFPLAEADEHLGRIRHWGFNCLRLLTTWEAVSHAGPDCFDEDYLDYFAEVCAKAGKHGLYVMIDFHQDVWSRMSGGDGAPGWTLEAVGLDFTKFDAASAAHVMQARYDYQDPQQHQASYPQMSWATNYRMPANGILWTLFWAGRTVTPAFRIDGLNVQDYLQQHLLNAMSAVAARVAAMPHVIGFDSLNEPGTGWLGQPLSPVLVDGRVVPQTFVLSGPIWTPLQALSVAAGVPTTLAVLTRDPQTGALDTSTKALINAQGISIWRDGMSCPFAAAGIYAIDYDDAQTAVGAKVPPHAHARALNENAFRIAPTYAPAEEHAAPAYNLAEHAYAPFFAKVSDTIRSHQPAWLLFAEIDPFGALSGRGFPAVMPRDSVNTSHWYDLNMIVTKHVSETSSADLLTGEVAFGEAGLRQRYVRQMETLCALGDHFSPNGAPMLLGEFGIPFDLDEGRAYAQWAQGARDASVWKDHSFALSIMYDAIDALLISSTQWNYTVTNKNDLRIGDQWNQEDLSIFSTDQHDAERTEDSGGRAIDGFCRPYAPTVRGRLQRLSWCERSGRLDVSISNQHANSNAHRTSREQATEIYLPRRKFTAGCAVTLSDATARYELDLAVQRLYVWHGDAALLDITVCRDGA